VDNVCVFGFAHKSKPIAIGIPDDKPVRALVETNNLGNRNEDLEKLVQIKEVQDVLLNDMLKAEISRLTGNSIYFWNCFGS
jgi:long-subunit acyl-CoA synthetase (AMP-forming)